MNVRRQKKTKICRFCMGKADKMNMFSIFDYAILSPAKIRINELLNTTIPQLEIEENDPLSKIICVSCLNKLTSLHHFQQMCLRTDQHQRHVLRKNHSPQLEKDSEVSNEGFSDPLEFDFAMVDGNENSIKIEYDNDNIDSLDSQNQSAIKEINLDETPEESNNDDLENEKISRKRKVLTIKEKAAIIKRLESGTSNTNLAKELNLSNSTISTIWKNREIIQRTFNKNSLQVKKVRHSQNYDIEEGLLSWINTQKDNNMPITGPILAMKANEIGRNLSKNFICSKAWIFRFRMRYNIVLSKSSDKSFISKRELQSL